MKKLLSLSVLAAALCATVGCSDSKTSSGTPVKAGSMQPSAPGGPGSAVSSTPAK